GEGIAYCDERDLDSWRLYMLSWSARARFETLDWDRASKEAEAVLRDVRTAPISRVTALTVLGHMRIRRGDPDCDTPLQEAKAIATSINETQRIAPVANALAEAAWLVGERERVAREVLPVYEMARNHRDPWCKGSIAVWLWRVDALQEIPHDIA